MNTLQARNLAASISEKTTASLCSDANFSMQTATALLDQIRVDANAIQSALEPDEDSMEWTIPLAPGFDPNSPPLDRVADYDQGALDMIGLYVERFHPDWFEGVKEQRIAEMMDLFREPRFKG